MHKKAGVGVPTHGYLLAVLYRCMKRCEALAGFVSWSFRWRIGDAVAGLRSSG